MMLEYRKMFINSLIIILKSTFKLSKVKRKKEKNCLKMHTNLTRSRRSINLGSPSWEIDPDRPESNNSHENFVNHF